MIKQNTPDWEEARRNKIGASDAPIILGESPWCTPWLLWMRKKKLLPDQKVNEAMKRGNEMEGKARKAFEKASGLLMEPKVVFYGDDFMASLDGITMEEDAIVELKCPSKEVHEMARVGKIPPYYMIQVQHQLMCTKLQIGHYASYYETVVGYDVLGVPIIEGEILIVIVNRDDEMIERIKDECEGFLGDDPPPTCEKDYVLIPVDPSAHAVVQDYLEFYRNYKVFEKKVKDTKPLLTELTDDGNCILTDQDGKHLVKMTRINQEGFVDWKKLCADKGILESEIKLYRKPQIGKWRITPFGDKEEKEL